MTERSNADLVLHTVSDETSIGRASRQAASDVLALLLERQALRERISELETTGIGFKAQKLAVERAEAAEAQVVALREQVDAAEKGWLGQAARDCAEIVRLEVQIEALSCIIEDFEATERNRAANG